MPGTNELNPDDIRIETYKMYRELRPGFERFFSNEYMGVRIIHLPTGTTVECHEEHNGHRNRARAIAMLKAKLADAQSINNGSLNHHDNRQ